MKGPGMWMPKRKDGKNWIVTYTFILDGTAKSSSRKFRVRADAADFIADTKKLIERDARVSGSSFKLEKL